jgi:hypothetical protein
VKIDRRCAYLEKPLFIHFSSLRALGALYGALEPSLSRAELLEKVVFLDMRNDGLFSRSNTFRIDFYEPCLLANVLISTFYRKGCCAFHQKPLFYVSKFTKGGHTIYALAWISNPDNSEVENIT